MAREAEVGLVHERRRLQRVPGVTWRSSWQGSTDGPLPKTWGIDSYPTVFVLDANHVLRRVNARGEGLGKVVDELLAEGKAAAGKGG